MAKQDPEGKRIARKNAAASGAALELLSTAHRWLTALPNLGFAEQADGLRKDLRRFHDAEAGRSGGHLEPRRKYKGRSQHLAIEKGRGLITIYLDESGQAQMSPDQPVFVLAGVALDDEEAKTYHDLANQLKHDFGLGSECTLHGPQIEKGVDDFAFGEDEIRQEEFRECVLRLVQDTPFRLFGAIIRKDVLVTDIESGETFGNLPPGLYEMALTFVAERFVDALHADSELKPCGKLVFESIGNLEDALHQRAFADLLIHGSEFVSGGCFRGWLRPGCEFKSKSGTHPLELADLAARSMLTWMRDGRPVEHEFRRIWAPKIATREEVERGRFGVKIFPDHDIRDEIVELRKKILGERSEA